MVQGEMREDDTSRLIQNLIHSRFAKLAVTADGWEALYQDPQDDRFWELTFPHGEMQGGGPRVLRVLSIEAARLKYGLPVVTERPLTDQAGFVLRSLWPLLIALLCSLLALAGSFYCGSLFLLLFDPHYHDGVAAVGGFIIGLAVAAFVFRAIWRKLGA